MRALLVLNERSRRGAREAGSVQETLERIGIACERDPRADGIDCVIAAGGDGTIIRTVPLAIEREVPLGVVPLGTFNDLARTLGVPLDTQSACEAIIGEKMRVIDVGRVNGVYFVNEASIGVSARIARRQTPELKQRYGFFGVVATVLQSIGTARPFHAQVQHDAGTESFRCVQLTVANNSHFGGFIDRADAAIDDGYLDLYAVDAENWPQVFSIARKIARRDPSSGEGLSTRRSAHFSIRTRGRHRIIADGEPAGMTPARFDLLPRALRIYVP